ncbi:probable receptor-like protein kinase At5g24010 [Vigna unguiculata]|uniref:Interleukin-1 receptor-associated kinase 4 n=1 Tax=Vigna unguiculata TaxID=3917 RepID=A0A4D6KVP5_VIGUN|nr:probable receptor-like protein kinase At5g24010 [Vigna unguiculata]QCD81492.1 interleukin-1 receptor-associated kinase 4 [Vigna unguiculata]
MEIPKLQIIQHSRCIPLLFLLQLLSLQFSSLGYNVPDNYFINCGSGNSVTDSGKAYVAESTLQTSFNSSNTETNQSSVPSPLYQTARIFRSDSWYKFNIDTNGTYLVRLHFFPFSSPSNLSSARFNVSVPGFWLLQNFNGRNDSNNNSALVKEFFMEISTPSIKITFRPLESSFAFVNAIELFVLPLHLISNKVARFAPIGGTSPLNGGLYSRVLETKHRLNVGGETTKDILLRNWIPDDIYLTYPENAKNRSPYQGQIVPRVGDDADGPNATSYTAPSEVYGTAKETRNISSTDGDLGLFNITWALPVDNSTDHFLRLHFCDYVSSQVGLTYFDLSIYDAHVIQVNNDGNVSNELPAPYYYDFVVKSDNSGHIKVSLTPNGTADIKDAFLNGLEIMKVIESSNSVPPDLVEPGSKHNRLPVLLGSVLGGLVLVFVVVLLGFLWRSKMRKEKPVENSDWLPIPVNAGGSSHSRLTDITSHGSPLPNINLGLKIPLIDLQLATKNFHASQLIGKGGFGNVYKGVLKNGMTVAVKRSQPGSGQGLPEFQTEIMVLSKIRHKHLVSLIGYCDERFEMILVYEYMEKGTLRDHLYNTKLPSLSWKVRLQICIDSARGLHYLHKGAAGGIIHRDVKSTNILLDENHVAKVADFGLSRSGPPDTQPHVTTGVKGTFGYLDPEYFRSQQLTEKSDVYSFGVVLLEVLCARAVIDPTLPRDQINLAEWGLLCKTKGILQEIIDPSIKYQIDQNSLRKFSETIEKCLQEDGSDRPTMGDVLWDLEYALQLQKGANAIQTDPYEDSSSSVSASLQLPNVRRLPSLSTLSEADDTIVRGDESDSVVDSVFSQLKIDDAR